MGCANLRLDTALCSSFDYGARENVEGECWLSTADRNSAGSAYTEWVHYDYYEMVSSTDAMPEVNSSQGAGTGDSSDNASSAHTISVCKSSFVALLVFQTVVHMIPHWTR